MERSHATVLLCLLRNINTLISVNQHFSWPGKSRKCKLLCLCRGHSGDLLLCLCIKTTPDVLSLIFT